MGEVQTKVPPRTKGDASPENKILRSVPQKRLNIHERIIAIMDEIQYIQKTGEVKKDNYTLYSYVRHDDVSRLVHPQLVKHNVVAIPTVKEWGQEGNRTWVVVEMRWACADDPEDCFTNVMIGYGVDTQDKGPGKAISYATKYHYVKTLVLETGDDSEKDQMGWVDEGDLFRYETLLTTERPETPLEFYCFIQGYDDDQQIAMYRSQNMKGKKRHDELGKEGREVFIKEVQKVSMMIAEKDDNLKEVTKGMSIPVRTAIWNVLSKDEKRIAKGLLQ